MHNITLLYYLPIATTMISILFAWRIFTRYRQRGNQGVHLLWWSGGVLVFGMGTFAEGWIALFGWNPVIFKFWYIVGALMGGAPLAQGTVWYLLRRKTAYRLTLGLITVVTIAAVCVLFSPINYAVVDPRLPSGKAFTWQWVRAFSPFINTYAVIFLVGGALYSAWHFYRHSRGTGKGNQISRDRFIGNSLIAAGALMPGIGGIYSRTGHTEILYLMEIIGITLIWLGYYYNTRKRPVLAPSPT